MLVVHTKPALVNTFSSGNNQNSFLQCNNQSGNKKAESVSVSQDAGRSNTEDLIPHFISQAEESFQIFDTTLENGDV